jgi:hypothetical protein
MAKDFITVSPEKAMRLARKTASAHIALKTEAVAARARLLAPGSMKHHIRPIFKGGPAPMGIVMCDHPATSFVIHGTNPHEIRPRNKKVLKFEVRGKTVFARVVHHPGTKPNNFLLKALIGSRTR